VTDGKSASRTRTSRLIKAPRETVFQAFLDPVALESWLVPETMTGKVHRFDARVGGGYEMSLYYPESETTDHGKTSAREDRYTAQFVELTPPSRIVEIITFDTSDPSFAGEMTMEVILEERAGGTDVTIAFWPLPPGIRPEDNNAGTRSSLEKLARLVE